MAIRPRAWLDTHEFLEDLYHWVDGLDDKDVPPREGDFAAHAGCSRKTVIRWLQDTSLINWDGFLGDWGARYRREGTLPG